MTGRLEVEEFYFCINSISVAILSCDSRSPWSGEKIEEERERREERGERPRERERERKQEGERERERERGREREPHPEAAVSSRKMVTFVTWPSSRTEFLV